jgi:hypothetical protein
MYMNSVDMANDLINRAKNLQKFEVVRELEEGINFNGSVPFDISGVGNYFQFFLYAITQEDAEAQVDTWLQDKV